MKDYEQTWETFWKEICENPDGSLNKDAIMREMHDYSFVLDQVPKVYMEITGGRLSKPNYEAGTVIAEYQEEVSRLIGEERVMWEREDE